VGKLRVRLRNAKRERLIDAVDLHILSMRANTLVASVQLSRGTSQAVVELLNGQPYIVKAFPSRHRAVGQHVLMPVAGDAVVELFCPIDPERVNDVNFPDYVDLPAELRRVLDSSVLEGSTDESRGQSLYGSLTLVQRAGLLNLFAKMDAFGFDETHTVWSAVQRVFRIRPDRVFADVDVTLRDRVKGEVAAQRFREVSGKLHRPPPGFEPAGSFKTHERYGNLQLSFFASLEAPLAFRIDADIDDAAGLGHTFQVLRNFITDGTTHPYDIHQILTFRQEVAPLYDLA
jgi:hypothetical protein